MVPYPYSGTFDTLKTSVILYISANLMNLNLLRCAFSSQLQLAPRILDANS